MQITIQKAYLFIVEMSENVFALFVVIVNFVFDFAVETFENVKERAEEGLSNFVKKSVCYIRALFGFNIYKLQTLKIENKTKTSDVKNIFKNSYFMKYSNLLAPPLITKLILRKAFLKSNLAI